MIVPISSWIGVAISAVPGLTGPARRRRQSGSIARIGHRFPAMKMELEMRLVHVVPLIVPTLFGLAGCDDSPPPQPVNQVIVQPSPTAVVPSAPMPPPPPMSELVPP